MSRYQSGAFAYGYDNPLREYFLQKTIFEDGEMEIVELVGSISDKYGSAANLLDALNKNNVDIPEDHRTKIMMDLPF